jgi:alkylated DNA nucleotide flippase Atl1
MDEEFTELVLRAVEQIPPGQATTYGDIALYLGRGGPRQVGHVMSRVGGSVAWWRVVRADGRPVRGLEHEALARLAADGTPLHSGRVDLGRARHRFEHEPGGERADTP